MIHVTRQPEPNDFDVLVRRPGAKFLRACPRPTSKQFVSHSYWRQILPQLHSAYHGICAYSCHWIPFDTGFDTVEHFISKKRHPNQAYEWNNYRLVCGTLNGRKREFTDVIDPFLVNNGDFQIKFPSMLVKASKNIHASVQKQVEDSIVRLGLNDEGTCLKSRLHWVSEYCANHITFDHLKRHAPFIAFELERQGIVDQVKQMVLTLTGRAP